MGSSGAGPLRGIDRRVTHVREKWNTREMRDSKEKRNPGKKHSPGEKPQDSRTRRALQVVDRGAATNYRERAERKNVFLRKC